MYRIKPNGNYILLIKDLDLTLTFDGNGAELTDEEFTNSIDIQKILRYLTVEKVNGKAKITNTPVENKIEIEQKSDMFVAHQSNDQIPEGMFVRNTEEIPSVIVEAITEKEIEEVLVTEETVTDVIVESNEVKTTIDNEFSIENKKSTNKKNNKSVK